MRPHLERTPKILLLIIGALVLLYVYGFTLEPTPRKLGGMLINLTLFYFILCQNKWVTYVTAAFLAYLAVQSFFVF